MSEFLKDNFERYSRDVNYYFQMRKRKGPNQKDLKACINFLDLYVNTWLTKKYASDQKLFQNNWQDPEKPEFDGNLY
jgi:hypothetical protein